MKSNSPRSPARYVAFLRAVNVAGHASLKMRDVRDAFAAAGCRNVKTFIQSGNVIFESPAAGVTARIQRARRRLGAVLSNEPVILLRTVREVERLVEASQYPVRDGRSDARLSVAFLTRTPRRRPAFPLICVKEALEVVAIRDREAVIIHRRKKNGFFGSPNSFIEKELGVLVTIRAWSTVTRIIALARGDENG